MKKTILAVLLIALTAAALPARTVLIATENTAYKRNLVEVLKEKLEAEDIDVVVIDHQRDRLDAVNPEEYDAVYVLNSGAQARVRPVVLEWLSQVADNDDNVILHTTQRTVWTPPVEVDSITSASRRSNIGTVTDDIVSRIKAKF